MADVRACLIDVYETVLSCDFAAHQSELPALAGVSPTVWNRAFLELAPAISDGRLTMAEGYAEVLRAARKAPNRALVAVLVRKDQDLLLETSTLFADTLPFLEMLRGRGIATAFVSNCAENTRPLLAALGLLDQVDVAVLSCEVGAAKPHPNIYRIALERLGGRAENALFVDDQGTYCAGAAALGIGTLMIDRAGTGHPADGVIRTLADVEGQLGP